MNSNTVYSEASVMPHAMARTELQNRALRAYFWVFAIFAGGCQAWVGRHTVAEDGLSYIEIGEAYFRSDWKNAINGYWSPLYSWILGLTLRIAHPSRVFESSVVHLVNFVIFICALAAFDFFLRQAIRYKNESALRLGNHKLVTFSDRGFVVVGYGLFLCASLNWITVSIETPDMLLSVFVYLAGAILLRIRIAGPDRMPFGALGK